MNRDECRTKKITQSVKIQQVPFAIQRGNRLSRDERNQLNGSHSSCSKPMWIAEESQSLTCHLVQREKDYKRKGESGWTLLSTLTAETLTAFSTLKLSLRSYLLPSYPLYLHFVLPNKLFIFFNDCSQLIYFIQVRGTLYQDSIIFISIKILLSAIHSIHINSGKEFSVRSVFDGEPVDSVLSVMAQEMKSVLSFKQILLRLPRTFSRQLAQFN